MSPCVSWKPSVWMSWVMSVMRRLNSWDPEGIEQLSYLPGGHTPCHIFYMFCRSVSWCSQWLRLRLPSRGQSVHHWLQHYHVMAFMKRCGKTSPYTSWLTYPLMAVADVLLMLRLMRPKLSVKMPPSRIPILSRKPSNTPTSLSGMKGRIPGVRSQVK